MLPTLILLIVGGYFIYDKFLRRRNFVPGNGKKVFVTGCDSGVGFSVVHYLHKLGVDVIAGCLDVGSEGANKLRETFPERLKIVGVDVTDQESVDRVIEEIERYVGNDGLWAAINNAGVMVLGEFDWQSWGQISSQVMVNYLGSMRISKAVLPLLKKTQGRLIFVSSSCGLLTAPQLSVYSSTKVAVEGLANGLRLELHKHGVKVLVVRPGDIARDTDILRNYSDHADTMLSRIDDESQKEELKQLKNRISKRLKARPPSVVPRRALEEEFVSAVLEENPSPHLDAIETGWKIFYKFSRILPTRWLDAILRTRIHHLTHKFDLRK